MHSVLIVDDEKDNLAALNRLLRKDFEVVTTDSPFEALKWVQKREFSVILSDQRMPELTGVELFEKIKALSNHSTRILLTGYTDIQAVIEAINRGNVYRYVAKPWDPEDLVLTIKQAAEAFSLRQELEQKNRALDKSNSELKLALDEISGLDRAKSRFLSLVSHELNTPLTVLQSFVGLAGEGAQKLPQDVKTAFGGIEKATRRFSQIVEEILLYLGADGKRSIQEEKLALDGLLKDVEKETQTVLKEKQIRLVKPESSSLKDLKLKGDPQFMKLAFKKLIEESCERAPSNSEIKIECLRKEGAVCIRVSREGDPITEGQFELLEMQNPLNHHKGLGLGFALVKRIAELHRGSLKLLRSDSKQTQIEFRVPSASQP